MEMTSENKETLITAIVKMISFMASRRLVSEEHIRSKLKKDYATISQKEFDEEWEFVSVRQHTRQGSTVWKYC